MNEILNMGLFMDYDFYVKKELDNIYIKCDSLDEMYNSIESIIPYLLEIHPYKPPQIKYNNLKQNIMFIIGCKSDFENFDSLYEFTEIVLKRINMLMLYKFNEFLNKVTYY